MDARAQRTNIVSEEPANLLEDFLSPADKALDQDRLLASIFPKRAEGILQLALRPLQPKPKRALVGEFRRKIRIFRRLREDGVHLARAAAKHAGELLVGLKRIALPRRNGLLVDDAREHFARPRAAVALVGDERLHDRKRRCFAILIDAPHFAEH